MAAWLAGAGGTLDARRTLVVGLDTIGSGAPVVLGAEGGLWPVRYRGADLALADRAASRSGVALKRWRIGGWTDPVLARLRGLPSLSILSVKDGGFPNYHLPSDVPEHVDWPCVAQCVDLAEAAVAEIGGLVPPFRVGLKQRHDRGRFGSPGFPRPAPIQVTGPDYGIRARSLCGSLRASLPAF